MKAIVTCIPCDAHNKRAAIASLKTTPDVGFHRTYGHTAAISSWTNLRFKPGFSVSASPRLGEERFTASPKNEQPWYETQPLLCTPFYYRLSSRACPRFGGTWKSNLVPRPLNLYRASRRNNKIFDIVGIAHKTSKCLGTRLLEKLHGLLYVLNEKRREWRVMPRAELLLAFLARDFPGADLQLWTWA